MGGIGSGDKREKVVCEICKVEKTRDNFGNYKVGNKLHHYCLDCGKKKEKQRLANVNKYKYKKNFKVIYYTCTRCRESLPAENFNLFETEFRTLRRTFCKDCETNNKQVEVNFEKDIYRPIPFLSDNQIWGERLK